MSKFTTEVRWICETFAEHADPDIDINTARPSEIITAAAPEIFNFDYPVYDERYRIPLEVKILRHYYTREIAEETVALWKLRLEDRLNIIMPYYNELYKTTLYEFNPLYDVDYTKTGHKNGTEVNERATTEHTVSNIERAKDESRTNQIAETENTASEVERERNEDRSSQTAGTEHGTGTRESEGQDSSAKTDANQNDATSHDTKIDLFSNTPQGSLEIFGIEEPPQQTVVGNSWLTTADRQDGTMSGHSEGTATSNTTGSNSESESSTSNVSRAESGNSESNINETEEGTVNRAKNASGNQETQGSETEDASSNRVKSDVGNITNLDEYIETVRGKMNPISYSKLIKEFRENILNIDKMIINELDDLFFGLWN